MLSMFLSSSNCCQVLSSDYLDLDVFLNIHVFYRLAGYRILTKLHQSTCDLIVLLRGIPPRVYTEFTGTVHVYDYVKESELDYAHFFPSASSIHLISVSHRSESSFFVASSYIAGYLPVIPEIWTSSSHYEKSIKTPLHISNFKPMQSDRFQEQLVQLARMGLIKIYGAKWDKIGILASSLTYHSANKLLAKANHCFGLMYPYQRGTSLSGRMWQAPLHGCYVLSEPQTNIFHCPGVVEVDDYLQAIHSLPTQGELLASEARDFWKNKTQQLASDLGLSLSFQYFDREVLYARLMLYQHHLACQWDTYVRLPCESAVLLLRRILRRLVHRSTN